MFHPAIKSQGAYHANSIECNICRKVLADLPSNRRFFYIVPNGSYKDSVICFYRCTCGTANWTHWAHELPLYNGIIIDDIPPWAEGYDE